MKFSKEIWKCQFFILKFVKLCYKWKSFLFTILSYRIQIWVWFFWMNFLDFLEKTPEIQFSVENEQLIVWKSCEYLKSSTWSIQGDGPKTNESPFWFILRVLEVLILNYLPFKYFGLKIKREWCAALQSQIKYAHFYNFWAVLNMIWAKLA